MTAEGTLAGRAYVEVVPDLSRFQTTLAKKLSRAFSSSGAGKELGKALSGDLSKGAKRVEGDMFGLSKRIKGVDRDSNRASRSAKAFAGDMFGVAGAAKRSGKVLESASSQLGRWRLHSDKASTSTRKLSSVISALTPNFRKLGRDVKTAVGGFDGFHNAMTRVNRASSFFRNIIRAIKFPLLTTGLGLAAQGLSALASGAVAATSALAPLTGALVALPAAAAAAAQGLGVIKLATFGLGETIKAAFAEQAKGGEQAGKVLGQQRDAANQVADAKRALSDVQRQETYSQEELTKARKEATRQLQDMRLASLASHDAEQSATLGLRQARVELRKTIRDPSASPLDVRLAEESIDQARNDLQSTRVEAKRARQDYADAQKKGVDGMPEVVAAKRSEEDATRAVADAQRGLQRAVEDSTSAMEDQGSAAASYQQKLAQLPAAGQRFARFIIGLKPKLDALRETAAEGFLPGVEKGIGSALRNFKPIQGIIAKTSHAFGHLSEMAGQKLGSAEFGSDLKRIGGTNVRILSRMGRAGLNLADALRHILVAAEPFLEWLSKSSLGLSKWIEEEAEAGRKTGTLADFFDRTRKTMELLGPILKGVGGALLNVGEAARPLGDEILKALGGAAEGWREWTDSVTGEGALKQHFTEVKPVIFELGRLVSDLGKAFFELGKQNGVTELIHQVRVGLVPALRDLVGATTGWAAGFLKDFNRLRREGTPAFDAFIQVLAEHAAQAGVTIAGVLFRSFIHASIWGKLVLGGWLLAKLGGLGAAAKLGGKLGKSMGEALIARLAPTLAAELETSGSIGALMKTRWKNMGKWSSRFFAVGIVLGVATLGVWFGQEIFNHLSEKTKKAIYQWGLGAGENFINALVGAINAGIRTINDALDKANVLGKLGVDAPNIGEVGKVNLRSKQELQEREARKALRGGFAEGPGGKLIPALSPAEQRIKKFSETIRNESARARESFHNQIGLLPQIADVSGKGINQKMLPALTRLQNDGGDKGAKFNERMSSAFDNLAMNVGASVQNIIKNTGGGLKALNVKDIPKFTPEPFSRIPSMKELRRQRGGIVPALATGGLASVVPGNITGDRHVLSLNGKPVAKVESKEGIFVGNRRMMGALNHINQKFPRFQSGGILGGLQSGARNLASTILDRFGGYISSGREARGTGSFHETGQAFDWVGGDWRGASRFVNSVGPSLLEGIYNGAMGGSTVSWDSGNQVPSSFWGATTWADHGDHIHNAIGGTFRAVVKKIARTMLKGPDGPLKDLGQAAIDKVWKAANNISAGGFSDNFKAPSGVLSKPQLRSLWGSVNPGIGDPNLMAAIGMAESGGNPSVTNSIGARGLWQIIPGTASAFGLNYNKLTDPAYNALGAGKILQGQGLDAWETYTNGAYSQYLKRGGMLDLMGLAKGGGLGPYVGSNLAADLKGSVIKKIRGRIKSIQTEGITKGLLGKLAGTDDAVEVFSEYASNAGTLTTEGPDGKPILGLFQGQNEEHWLTGTLSNLLTLRNLLLRAKEQVEAVKAKIIEQLKVAVERVKQVKETILNEQKRRTNLMQQLSRVRDAIDRAQGDAKRPLQLQARDLQDRITQIDSQQGDRRVTLQQLAGKLIPALKGKKEELGQTVLDILGDGGEQFMGLSRVQGLSGPTNPMTGVPPIGLLGGEVLSVQSRLRDLGIKSDKGGEDDNSERADLFETLFRNEQQRRFASDAQKVVLQGWDTLRQGIMAGLPKFHIGGIVPGPRGSERPIMALGGEGVFTEEQMKGFGGGNTLSIDQLIIHPDGSVTATSDDGSFDARVRKVLRRAPGTGRKHPSSAFSVRR